jgi:hypothetical protein
MSMGLSMSFSSKISVQVDFTHAGASYHIVAFGDSDPAWVATDQAAIASA